jgi:DNA-binding response OmpR family regulator
MNIVAEKHPGGHSLEEAPIPFSFNAPQRTRTRKRILIADDNALFVRTVAGKLSASGYEVLTAADGADTVSTARREKPDLILLDIVFPPDVAHGGGVPWDGFLIMRWVHQFESAQRIPVIMVTGCEPEKYRERAMQSGAIAFFTKPLNFDELLPLIGELLGQPGSALN